MHEVSRIGKKHVRKFEEIGNDQKKQIVAQKKYSSDQLHKLRKHLKKQVYLEEALGDKSANDSQNKKISELLGQWHDCHVMAAEIKKDLTIVKLPREEVKLLEKIARDYTAKAKKLEDSFK